MNTLAALLDEGLRTRSPSIVSAGTRLEASELRAIADRIARDLARGGVAPDEPVHVMIGNRPADLAALLGVWRAGAVAVPVHMATPAHVMSALRLRTGARFMVDETTVGDMAPARPPERPLLHGAALIVFTSGSTGEPKGVVIGHARLAGKIAVLSRLIGIRADDTVLVPLQLTFIFGIWVSLLTITSGARLHLLPKFSAAAAGAAFNTATVAACVPTMLRTLGAEPPAPAPGLHAILTGGEPLGAALTHAIRAMLPRAGITDLYGLTETGACDFCLMPADQPAGIGTIGAPTERVAYRIAPDTGVGGELQVRTPFGMLGYLDAHDLTQAAFADGFLRTGDLARQRADGRVELTGRANDIISRGGYKIAPLEVEGVLARHPDIAAVLCAGVADARLGERIHAVIVPRAGTAPDAQAIRAWAADYIERYKLPDAIHIRDSLPVGRTGKTDRTAIGRLVDLKD